MKTSCSSWCYHRTFDAGQMDQMSWLDECVTLGLDGVELLAHHFPATDRDYLRKLKKACSDRFLTIAAVSPGGHLTVSDDRQRAREVEQLGEWVEIASFLGAPRVRFFVGSGEELEAGGQEVHLCHRMFVARGDEYHDGEINPEYLAYRRTGCYGHYDGKADKHVAEHPPAERLGEAKPELAVCDI